MVSTAYQEKHSATVIRQTIVTAMVRPRREPRSLERKCNTIAPSITKLSSATVATDRPTNTFENQVSHRQMRCTSARGSSDRNAHPATKRPESSTTR